MWTKRRKELTAAGGGLEEGRERCGGGQGAVSPLCWSSLIPMLLLQSGQGREETCGANRSRRRWLCWEFLLKTVSIYSFSFDKKIVKKKWYCKISRMCAVVFSRNNHLSSATKVKGWCTRHGAGTTLHRNYTYRFYFFLQRSFSARHNVVIISLPVKKNNTWK